MSTVQPFPEYRVIGHQFQYSGGVAAEPGFRIERARFTRPVPLAAGFDAIEAYLGIGHSPTALCACELRSPGQFTDVGFVAFDRHHVERLAAWGIFRDEVNPVARSNVCRKLTRQRRRRSTPSATPCRAGTARCPALSPPEAAKRARGRLQSIPLPGSSADAAPHDKPSPERNPLAAGWRVCRAVEADPCRCQDETRIVMIAIGVG